jgi:nucleosome assembly protein 1-like 1
LVAEFDERAEKMKDEDYEKLEVPPCDVKAIQNSPNGVSDFWQRALVNHSIGAMISEKDRPILGYLLNIELELHSEDKGEGFDLIFTFAPNSYFDGTELKVEMYKRHGMAEKKECTEIQWKEGCNPTVKKQKKKKKGKKVTVEVKQDSFFNFFKSIDPENSKKDENEGDDDEEDHEDEQGQLQDDLDTADQIKEDLIPLALEYYLGVIEEEGADSEGEDDDGDDEEHDNKKPKKSKKGGAGA